MNVKRIIESPESLARRERSAEWHSAVSPIGNRPGCRTEQDARFFARLAECHSAIQQSATLRYGKTPLAFTLIELILAIGVMAIALTAINAVFFSALRLRESANRVVAESLPIEMTLATLRRDLQGAMPPSAEGIFSGDFKVGNNVTSQGSGRPVDIEMFTTTGVLRDDEPWGEVQMVTYSLRQPDNRSIPGQDLYRSVTRNLLATMTQQPEDQYMMSGIERLEFSCCDGVNWLDTWDSTVTTNLPTAVRVRILLANTSSGGGTPRPIELVVPLDSQSHTNQN